MYRGQDSNFGSIYFEFDAEARAKFVSLIDRMINDCGSEVERLMKELAESKERSSYLETKLAIIEDYHSLEMSRQRLRSASSRELGKTASSLLKAKKAKKLNRRLAPRATAAPASQPSAAPHPDFQNIPELPITDRGDFQRILVDALQRILVDALEKWIIGNYMLFIYFFE
ncbi:hypothetical protein F2Q69_00048558 [Brassica cretica]|uniref:Uncharacterized protein n=1 Tax=Brassica cretica TaxID=69181 RepID=A0A8S9PW00_BRACR|nr:hypothetical protein F2Q69_00048558 [Brassica cretica]